MQQDLVVGLFDATKSYDSSPLRFLRFKGRWGNNKRGCGLYEKVSGECILKSGPTNFIIVKSVLTKSKNIC